MEGKVHTIREKCRRCYTCVRECPARAVKISGGQAVVMEDRCISCGHCVRVCSQGAKQVVSAVDHVWEMIDDAKRHVIAIVAPSFPTYFAECDPPARLIGALKQVGFSSVMEVAFGADLISKKYKEHYDKFQKPIITSSCPAIDIYIMKYMPDLTANLARAVSPMIAMGRAIKWKLDPEADVVFIGPCVAKKAEAQDPQVAGVIDEVLTFQELRKMFNKRGIKPVETEPFEFEGPKSKLGVLFPVSSGLLKTAGIETDIEKNDVLTAEGKERVLPLLKSFQNGEIEPRFLDLLFCEGCVNGPFAPQYDKKFHNRDAVIKYFRNRQKNFHKKVWEKWMDYFKDLDITRDFRPDTEMLPMPSEQQIREKLKHMGKEAPIDELNCGACGYSTCREHAIAVLQGLAESEMCLPYTVDRLEDALGEVKESHNRLKDAQEQILHNEKMAAMGQLAAGVAHEVNNPLGTVLLYSHMMLEDLSPEDQKRDDVEMIIKETERCKNIISDLLNFSRQSRLNLTEVDIEELIRETIRPLVKDTKHGGVNFEYVFDHIPAIAVDPDQMKQVFINLVQNSIDAIHDMGKITIATELTSDNSRAIIVIFDDGDGIPEDILPRIFTPFFTTKPLGKGTGLGLSIVYGIIKMHRGSIRAESTPGIGTKMFIEIPYGLGSNEMIGAKVETVAPSG